MNKVEQFNQQRALLFSIAYRMLGSAMEAEDMVQEAFLRWQEVNEAEVKSPKAYLSTVITRLCIDQLRSARVQREEYIGPWLPEPILTTQTNQSDDPVLLAESVSMAFLVLLEHLNPVERAVFLLREVFDYEYAEIARIVDKSEAHCRQLARRARHYLTAQRPRFEPASEEQQRLTTQFMETCLTGDLSGLVDLLADDIVLWSDGGGKVASALRPICGAIKVARFFLTVGKKIPSGFVFRLAWINGQPGIIGYENGRPSLVITLDMGDGHIQRIYIVRNPDKLRGVPSLSAEQS